MIETRNPQLSAGHVISPDGTRIGYLRTGDGPAVVLVHGSMETARSHLLLAAALADRFTVYLPDRRGRGMSGPHREDHRARTEVEDLEAVIRESGARCAFGVSASGIVVLEAARTIDGLEKVAVYEPAYVTDPTPHLKWVERFDRELAAGSVGAAMVTSMYGLELAPAYLKVIPRPLMASMTEMMMRREDRTAEPGDATMRRLAPTIHHEGALIAELAGPPAVYRQVDADVLLLGGSKGLPFLKPGRDILAKALPRVTRVELVGFDHGSSSDPSPTNGSGSPTKVSEVARLVGDFFA